MKKYQKPKSKEDYTVYLKHIVQSCDNISKILKDNGEVDDFYYYSTLERMFEIIGEAASKIPEKLKSKYPEIEWRNIKDFRNLIIHGYFGVDYNVMIETAKTHIPILKKQIKSILSKEK